MKIYRFITLMLLLGMLAQAIHAQKAQIQQLDTYVHAVSLMGYTSLVVEGSEGLLITDTANPYRAQILKETLSDISSKPVTYIVLSHEHFDHTGGTEVFPNAKIIAQQNVQNLKHLDPLDLFPDKVDILYRDRLFLNLGTTSLELWYPGAADGAAISVIYLPKEGIALTADMYVDDGLNPGMFLSHTNLLGVRHLLNHLVSLKLKYAINVHSSNTGTKNLERTAGFLNALYDKLLSELKAANSEDPHGVLPKVFELKQQLKLPEYKHWKHYEDLPIYIQKMAFDIIHGG